MIESIFRVFVPIALTLLMFGLGLQLVGGDFLRLARYPKAVLAGLLGQIVLLPAIAYLLVNFLSLPLAISAGIVILAACPGGVASSSICFLARADVALSVTLTALSTVLAPVFAPIIVGLGLDIIQLGTPEVSRMDVIALPLVATFGQLLLVMVLPLSVGMIVRRYTERLALRSDRWVRIGNVIVLLVLLLGAFAVGFDFLLKNFQVLGPVLLALNLASMLGGYLLARAFGLAAIQRQTIAIELSIHNVGLGLLIALNLLQQPEWIVAPSVYSIVMMLTAFALITGLRLQRSNSA
ncbi:MAG TPA: bile acid:sodium symporter family protein [Xanthomonadales bacterium]|nr:bile acid:sodium symporter family protein [Xanthomonadales bacterium]